VKAMLYQLSQAPNRVQPDKLIAKPLGGKVAGI
jgi:hypothetical protein